MTLDKKTEKRLARMLERLPENVRNELDADETDDVGDEDTDDDSDNAKNGGKRTKSGKEGKSEIDSISEDTAHALLTAVNDLAKQIKGKSLFGDDGDKKKDKKGKPGFFDNLFKDED